jgi:thiosulfate dehydrogenase
MKPSHPDSSLHFSKPLHLLAGLVLAGSLGATPAPVVAEEIDSSIARGGRLYDKWWKVNGGTEPKQANPAYPATSKYKGKGDWRCKECHGWDYLGKDGAYAKGGHFTGIKGIKGAMNMAPAKVRGVLTDKNHGLGGMMNETDLNDLAMFVSKGQVDMARYIDPATRKAKGDKARGEPIFNTVCANCHGRDGTLDEDGKPLASDSEPLGLVANDNPWEALHKIRNGQPGEHMPAMRAFDARIAVDLLAHMQTLPTKVVQAAR